MAIKQSQINVLTSYKNKVTTKIEFTLHRIPVLKANQLNQSGHKIVGLYSSIGLS